MKRDNRQGFTLIEVVVSTALLTVAVTGFMMLILENTAALARIHRMDHLGYGNSALVEGGQGVKTGESWRLAFVDDNMAVVQTVDLYEYQVGMKTYQDLEGYRMYYVDYK